MHATFWYNFIICLWCVQRISNLTWLKVVPGFTALLEEKLMAARAAEPQVMQARFCPVKGLH